MGANADALMMVRAGLFRSIDHLAALAVNRPLAEIAAEADDIRRTARDYGLDALAEVAHGLESALGHAGGRVAIASYVSAMRDAVACDNADPAIVSTYLAAIRQRLYF